VARRLSSLRNKESGLHMKGAMVGRYLSFLVRCKSSFSDCIVMRTKEREEGGGWGRLPQGS
jgi:hypothetical protein